jgi:hypothetical protein
MTTRLRGAGLAYLPSWHKRVHFVGGLQEGAFCHPLCLPIVNYYTGKRSLAHACRSPVVLFKADAVRMFIDNQGSGCSLIFLHRMCSLTIECVLLL